MLGIHSEKSNALTLRRDNALIIADPRSIRLRHREMLNDFAAFQDQEGQATGPDLSRSGPVQIALFLVNCSNLNQSVLPGGKSRWIHGQPVTVESNTIEWMLVILGARGFLRNSWGIPPPDRILISQSRFLTR